MRTARFQLHCLIVAICCAIAAPCFANDRTITVIFRVDDYSAATNTAVEAQMFELFEKHNVPLTVAVVPRVVENMYAQADGETPGRELPLPQNKIDLLRTYVSRNIVEPALHGYNHELTSAPGSSPGSPTESAGYERSELAGLSEAEQTRRITQGKRLLDEAAQVNVVTFIPPFNAYDATTCAVLQRAGFTALSAGLWCPPTQDSTLGFFPSTSTLNDCRAAIAAARKSADAQPTVVVLFHETDIVEAFSTGSITLAQIGDLLAWVSAQDDVQTMTVRQAAAALPQFDAARYALWTDLRDRPRETHRKLLPRAAWGINEALWAAPGKPWFHIPSEADITRRWYALHAAVAGFWLTVLIAWFAIVRAIARLLSRRIAFAAGLTIAAAVWLLWARAQFPIAQVTYAATAVLGITLALLSSQRTKTKPTAAPLDLHLSHSQ